MKINNFDINQLVSGISLKELKLEGMSDNVDVVMMLPAKQRISKYNWILFYLFLKYSTLLFTFTPCIFIN